MKWKKLGRVISPDDIPSGYTHASVPIIEFLNEDNIRLYFSSRDTSNRSHLLFSDFKFSEFLNKKKVKGPVLSPGKIGCFDDSGTMGCCLLNLYNDKFLYYVGWNLGVTVPFRNSIGLAKWDNNQQCFLRCFDGPIVDRTKDEPYFTASCHVFKDSNKFKMWYLSCVDWNFDPANRLVHRYLVKYAESMDGIMWVRNNEISINFKSESEYAISVPRIIKDNDSYKVWYSYRGPETFDKYKIGYGVSDDGIAFTRADDIAGIDIASKGWDSDMVCYPFVFDYLGKRYMLYNGNGYGLTGIGLALLQQEGI